MNKKSSICAFCHKKTDQRIKYKGKSTCPLCLDRLHGYKNHALKYDTKVEGIWINV